MAEISSNSVNKTETLLLVVPRRHADHCLKEAPEVRNVAEAPGIRDVADLTMRLRRIGERGLALFYSSAEQKPL